MLIEIFVCRDMIVAVNCGCYVLMGLGWLGYE